MTWLRDVEIKCRAELLAAKGAASGSVAPGRWVTALRFGRKILFDLVQCQADSWIAVADALTQR